MSLAPNDVKKYFSVVVVIWIAFGMTRAVFSFVMAVMSLHGMVSCEKETVAASLQKKGHKQNTVPQGKDIYPIHFLLLNLLDPGNIILTAVAFIYGMTKGHITTFVMIWVKGV